MGSPNLRNAWPLLAALIAGCAEPAAEQTVPAGPLPWVAIGQPLGDEPKGWEDLRGVPFELHFVGRDPDAPPGTPESVLLELRLAGRVEIGFDGTRRLPSRLFRREVDRGPGAPVVFGYGWDAAVQLLLPPETRGPVLREATLDMEFVRVTEETVHEATLEAGGVLDPAPPPFGGPLTARKTCIVLDVAYPRRKRGDPEPTVPFERPLFDPVQDLVEARDAAGRRVAWNSSSLGGGTRTDTFAVYGEIDAPIAYPVRIRTRVPLASSRRTYRFVIRDMPLPE